MASITSFSPVGDPLKVIGERIFYGTIRCPRGVEYHIKDDVLMTNSLNSRYPYIGKIAALFVEYGTVYLKTRWYYRRVDINPVHTIPKLVWSSKELTTSDAHEFEVFYSCKLRCP